MRSNTTEKHGVALDMAVFQATVSFLSSGPYPERVIPDLRIKSSSPAVDTGTLLANINDNFRGRAPDIGAYEAGDSLPIYGPRPPGVDEETMAFFAERTAAQDRNPALLTLTPLPARDRVTVAFSNQETILQAGVYSISGKLLAVLKPAGNHAVWRCGNLPAGLYVIRAEGISGQRACRAAVKI
jgi:hypothetical protein